MAVLKITPSSLQGSLSLPPSKSHTMRALLFASRAKGTSTIYQMLSSPDTDAMVRALRSFGVTIDMQKEKVDIIGRDEFMPCADVLDVGNSGQALRFIGAMAAHLPTYTVLTGDRSIRNNRVVEPLLSALTQLGAFATSSRLDGKAPILIRGPMRAGSATLCGKDSQPVSALLMACAFLSGTTRLSVQDPGEKPWVELTLSWLRRFGASVTHDNYTHYELSGSLSYPGFSYTVPGDFSSLAFPLAAALLIPSSSLLIENVDMEDVQGDKKILFLLQEMGANISWGNKNLMIKSSSLRGMKIDGNELIDAIAILAVLGCFAEGKTEIVNAAIARKKESDRLHAITHELRKMGAKIDEREDGLTIWPSLLRGASLHSHGDHRIALALAVAALAAKGPSTIEGAECIAKSYPNFAPDFQRVGACIA